MAGLDDGHFRRLLAGDAAGADAGKRQAGEGEEGTPAAQLLDLVRRHWTIENCVHWPRDMSFHEDRLHGRAIGGMLAWLRNIALNLIRRVWPATFIPDAWSRLSIDPQVAVRWLHLPLMN